MHLLCYRLVKTLKVNAGKGLGTYNLRGLQPGIPAGFEGAIYNLKLLPITISNADKRHNSLKSTGFVYFCKWIAFFRMRVDYYLPKC
jgi:hypothetical protein